METKNNNIITLKGTYNHRSQNYALKGNFFLKEGKLYQGQLSDSLLNSKNNESNQLALAIIEHIPGFKPSLMFFKYQEGSIRAHSLFELFAEAEKADQQFKITSYSGKWFFILHHFAPLVSELKTEEGFKTAYKFLKSKREEDFELIADAEMILFRLNSDEK